MSVCLASVDYNASRQMFINFLEVTRRMLIHKYSSQFLYSKSLFHIDFRTFRKIMLGKNKSHVFLAKCFFIMFLVIELFTNLITHRAYLRSLSKNSKDDLSLNISTNAPNNKNATQILVSQNNNTFNFKRENIDRDKTVITVSMFMRLAFSAFGVLSAIGRNTTSLTVYNVMLTLMDLLFLYLKTCHGLPFPMLPVLDAALIFSSGFLVIAIKVQHERLQNEKLNSLLPTA